MQKENVFINYIFRKLNTTFLFILNSHKKCLKILMNLKFNDHDSQNM